MFSVYSKNKGIGLTVPILLEGSVYIRVLMVSSHPSGHTQAGWAWSGGCLSWWPSAPFEQEDKSNHGLYSLVRESDFAGGGRGVQGGSEAGLGVCAGRLLVVLTAEVGVAVGPGGV